MGEITLWKHQADIVEQAKPRNHFAFFMAMGTGKTAVAIHTLQHKCSTVGHQLKTLVICPPLVVENWRREFRKHSSIPSNLIKPLMGSGKKRAETLRAHITDSLVFITNYESLLMKDLYAALHEWKIEVLIADEIHKCKSITAKRTKQLIKLSQNISHKYILTGTPILNNPMDIFSQFLILDNGETFGHNFWAFRATYFYDKNIRMPSFRHFPDWQIKPGALNEINQKIYRKAARVTKEECLDLPPLVRQTIYVDMTPEQRRMYEEMKQDFITYLGDAACVAQLALTKGLRLQQIVSGYAKMEDGSIKNVKDNPRQQALEDLLESLVTEHKVIVWAVFKENYEQIRKVCEKVGVKYVECHGELSQGEKDDSVTSFNDDPSVRVFFGHPRSGGIGVNLTTASYSIFYSRGFSLEDDLQAESRNHRGGSEVHEKITRIDIVAKDTIDEIVLDALAKKETISEKVLARIKG